MAETAAHLVDHVFPPLPVYQWVLSVPKRLRWYLEREPKAVSAVLQILLRVIAAYLRQGSGAGSHARLGAVSFIHRFEASLNRHVHSDENHPGFRASRALSGTQIRSRRMRVRGRQRFARSGLIEPEDVREMLVRDNSGFSLDAAVRVGAHGRAGLERLLRHCARPTLALERLELRDDERVVYRLPKPQRDGTTALTLTPPFL